MRRTANVVRPRKNPSRLPSSKQSWSNRCQEQVSLGEGYIKTPFKVRDGYIDLPTGPGLGIELDKEAMKDKIGHDWKNQESTMPIMEQWWIGNGNRIC